MVWLQCDFNSQMGRVMIVQWPYDVTNEPRHLEFWKLAVSQFTEPISI